MPVFAVPDLKRKFDLLCTHPPGRTWPKLGEAFGAPSKTLQSWQGGSENRDAGLMPDWAVSILTRLIGELLPEPCSPDALRQLVLGPASDLEDEVRTGPARSLLALIASEPLHDTAALIPGDRGRSSWRSNQTRIRPDSGCRLPSRSASRSGAAFDRRIPVLRHAHHAWAMVKAAASPAEPTLILVL